MSTASKRKHASRDRELQRLRRRLNSPRPDLPILRSSERPQTHEAGRASQPPEPPTSTPASTTASAFARTDDTQPPDPLLNTRNPQPAPPQSLFPEWTRLLPMPGGLTSEFRRWLYRHISSHFNPDPADTQQQFLAARLALALAHQHLAAAREPDQISPVWLRYEAMANRQYRSALRDWNEHHKQLRANALRSASSGQPAVPDTVHSPRPPAAHPQSDGPATEDAHTAEPQEPASAPTPMDPAPRTTQPVPAPLPHSNLPLPIPPNPHNPTFARTIFDPPTPQSAGA